MWLATSLIGLAQSQANDNNAPIDLGQSPNVGKDDGMIFTQDGESHQISYLDRVFADDDVNVECTSNNMCIQLNKQFLINEQITENFEGLHLKNCEKGNRTDSAEYVKLCTELGFNTCGTEMHMNTTHVSYLNRLFTTNGNAEIQKGSVIMGTLNEYIVPWHCVYPLEYLVGLSSGTGEDYGYFIPKIYEVVTVTLLLQPGEGTGEFPVAMMLYQDNTYETVYNEPPMLNVTDRLFVQTHLLKGPEDAVIQTKECWATASQNIDDEINYTLIEDFCVDPNADERAKVDLLTNGVGFTSRWEANVFKFVNQDNVYLHCRVRICFPTADNQCDAFNCETSRKRRAAGQDVAREEDVVVSIGPLTLGADVIQISTGATQEEEIIEEIIDDSDVKLPGYFIYALMGCLLVVVALMAAIIVLSYKRKKNSKTRQMEQHDNAAFST